jgi:chromosome segregation ATPase
MENNEVKQKSSESIQLEIDALNWKISTNNNEIDGIKRAINKKTIRIAEMQNEIVEHAEVADEFEKSNDELTALIESKTAELDAAIEAEKNK